MESPEQLLHEAQYAFHSISYGQTRGNKRNTSRAISLCKKIIRKYPAGIEADEAHAILRRLGEEAYTSNLAKQHRHITEAEHHRPPSPKQTVQALARTTHVESLNWSGLISSIFRLPKFVLALIVFAGIFLFGLFGPLLLLPLLALVFLSGPFRNRLKPEQHQELNKFIARVNDYLESQRS